MPSPSPDTKRTIIASVVSPETPTEEASRSLEEIRSLITTLGDNIIVSVIQKRGRPSGKTYLGTGKIRELLSLAQELNANQIVINGFLTPIHIRNLLDIFPPGFEVLDRVELILKIFRRHATTEESRLQIELAETRYLLPRLHGRGKVMSRLGGGIGTRGPGEQQKESEKQNLKSRITQLKKSLAKRQRLATQTHTRRSREGKKVISLVGYTNAGKSTLFHSLTKKPTLIANKLFATLDTLVGRLYLPKLQEEVLLSDTIGFISDLPPFLIESFQTTLNEIRHADLLLHIIDYSDPLWKSKKTTVEKTLQTIKCDHLPRINLYNKTDLLPSATCPEPNALCISALNPNSLENLKNKISKLLTNSA